MTIIKLGLKSVVAIADIIAIFSTWYITYPPGVTMAIFFGSLIYLMWYVFDAYEEYKSAPSEELKPYMVNASRKLRR